MGIIFVPILIPSSEGNFDVVQVIPTPFLPPTSHSAVWFYRGSEALAFIHNKEVRNQRIDELNNAWTTKSVKKRGLQKVGHAYRCTSTLNVSVYTMPPPISQPTQSCFPFFLQEVPPKAGFFDGSAVELLL